MTKVIISGHAGYGTAMKRNINMLVGETPDFILPVARILFPCVYP